MLMREDSLQKMVLRVNQVFNGCVSFANMCYFLSYLVLQKNDTIRKT